MTIKLLCYIGISITPIIGQGQIYFSNQSDKINLVELMDGPTIGAGVSVYDINDNGWDDITLGTSKGKKIEIYINNEGSLVRTNHNIDNTDQVKQITWVDYDNDGDKDLYVAVDDSYNKLYAQIGPMLFEDVTIESKLSLIKHRSYGAIWTDINRDGWLDLYYNYRSLDRQTPNGSRLYLNNGNGTFSDITIASGTKDEGKAAFASGAIDINNDLWPDLYTAHDRKRGNTLLLNIGGQSFRDISDISGTGIKMDAMCVAFADLYGDGCQDIYITNIEEGNQLLSQQNIPKTNVFQNIAPQLNIELNHTSWGAIFLDAENDGDIDLYVSSSVTGNTNSLFLNDIKGKIFRQQHLDGDTASSYANAIGDINNDGLLDILVQNNYPNQPDLWINESQDTNSYIKVSLEGVISNRDGVGSYIECHFKNKRKTHYTSCGQGFLGQNSQHIHFGLGSLEIIDSIIVRWPSGHWDVIRNIRTKQRIKIVEGQSTNGSINIGSGVEIVPRPQTTSVQSHDTPPKIIIYPNPARDIVFFSIAYPIKRARVLDYSGRCLIQEVSERKSIDISLLPSGIYLLELEFTPRKKIRKVFVKK